MSKQNKTILTIAVILIALLALFFVLSKNRLSQVKENGGSAGAARPISSADHLKGQAGAPVEMIVYSDFECPFCAQFADTMEKIEGYFRSQIVIAFRHYPLPGHPDAQQAAEASECAAEQGKFWEMHDKLFADNAAGRMSVGQFKQDAADLGLNQEQFNQCLDSGQYRNKVSEQKAAGGEAGVTGTPTSFINGFIYPGAYPFEDFTSPDGTPEKGMKTIISNLLQ
ncbi:MAG: thioredoxin domain-containing protein [bacterium]|nr:thioredoxin domain-containing protein [bacterium]